MSSTTLSKKVFPMFNAIPKEQLSEMLEQAVYQQLFLGKDRIMGRIPKDTMNFKDVGHILGRFIQTLEENIKYLHPEKLEIFLGYFEKFFGLELSEVKTRVEQNFEGMGMGSDFQGEEIIILYMVLTKMLENARRQAYKKFGLRQIKIIYKNKNKNFNEAIELKLQDLASNADSNLSLLYNLCFIRLLADSFDEKRIRTNSKRQITRKVNQIIPMLH
ncbi:MAG: hypothetical protein ACTSWY_12770 [Promethearchaeota archaeon]